MGFVVLVVTIESKSCLVKRCRSVVDLFKMVVGSEEEADGRGEAEKLILVVHLISGDLTKTL